MAKHVMVVGSDMGGISASELRPASHYVDIHEKND